MSSYSGALPAGVRSADCYRDIDTTAGAFQEEEIAGAIRVGQSKVDTLGGAPRRALSDDLLRLRAGLQADARSGLLSDTRGQGVSPLLRSSADGGPPGAPPEGTPQATPGAGDNPLPFVDPGALPDGTPQEVPLGIPTSVTVDDSAELAASRAGVETLRREVHSRDGEPTMRWRAWRHRSAAPMWSVRGPIRPRQLAPRAQQLSSTRTAVIGPS